MRIEIKGKVGTREVGAFCAGCGVQLMGEEVFQARVKEMQLVLGHPVTGCEYDRWLVEVPTVDGKLLVKVAELG